MTLELRCYPDANFKRVLRRFVNSDMPIRRTIKAAANAGAASMVREARANLRGSVPDEGGVYSAPLPASAASKGGEKGYLMQGPNNPEGTGGRRIGTVWRACQVVPAVEEGDEVTAAAYVNDSNENFAAYFYALILNYGGVTIDYDKRPFWSRAAKTMAAKYSAIGEIALGSMKKQLEGREEYAELSSGPEGGSGTLAEGFTVTPL